MRKISMLAALLLTVVGCAAKGNADVDEGSAMMDDQAKMVLAANVKADTATFAGGCFWSMQVPFDTVKGVIATTVGYSGGTKPEPTYEEVCTDLTGHLESVQVIYDPSVTSYNHLLDIFWRNINPTQANGQFADHGEQYHTAIFYHSDQQRAMAEASKKRLAASGKFSDPIVTAIRPAKPFWPAEEYHQKYARKHHDAYMRYRIGSGRQGYLEEMWGSK